MLARYRVAAYLVLWVVSLLVVPLAAPPARQPTYGPPPIAPSYGWAYGPTLTYEGTPIPGQGALAVTVNFTGPLKAAMERWTFAATGSVAARWALSSWELVRANGSLLNLSWRCPAGLGWVNLTHAVPNGLLFPLQAGFQDERSSAARAAGACIPGGAATVLVTSDGGYAREVPYGGSLSCTLYLCNSVREYAASWSLSLAASGSASPFERWSLQGLYDPTVSGYRFLSTSPGPLGTYANGSLNLSGSDLGAQPTPPQPAPEVEFLDSVALVLLVPAVAILFEYLLFRRETRKGEEETERAVLAALTPDEAEGVPPGEVYDTTMDETVPAAANGAPPPPAR